MSNNDQACTALLPCPFCNGAAVILTQWLKVSEGFLVKCSGCSITMTGWDSSEEAAITAWNTRIGPKLVPDLAFIAYANTPIGKNLTMRDNWWSEEMYETREQIAEHAYHAGVRYVTNTINGLIK